MMLFGYIVNTLAEIIHESVRLSFVEDFAFWVRLDNDVPVTLDITFSYEECVTYDGSRDTHGFLIGEGEIHHGYTILIIEEVKPDLVGFNPYKADWAGYNDEGNDFHGHLHVHPDGDFLRRGDFKGVRGFYCSARLIDGWCDDPSSKLLALADNNLEVIQ